MKNVIISFFLCLFSLSTSAQLLDPRILFSQPDHQHLVMSPDGNNIAYIKRNKSSFSILNKNMQSNELLDIKNVNYANYLIQSYWVNDNVLYFELKGSGHNHHYLVKKVDNEFIEIKIRNFRYLVSGYRHREQILVADKVGSDKFEVSLINIDSLFSSEKKKLLFNSHYKPNNLFYDSTIEKLIGFQESEGELLLSARSLSERRWNKLTALQLKGEYYFSPIGMADPDTMIVLTNQHTDKISVYEYLLKENKLGKLIYAHEKYDVTGAKTENGAVSSVSYVKNGIPYKEYLNINKQGIIKDVYKKLGDMTLSTLSVDRSKTRYLIFASSPVHAGTWYHFNTQSKKLTRLVSAYEKYSKYEFSPSQLINFKSHDGLEIEAILTKPLVNDRETLLVMPHGGPIGVRDVNAFDAEMQYLVNRGFTILRVNFRGSFGYGKHFQSLGVGALGEGIETDIQAAMQEVKRKNNFKHTCTIGRSYGGYSSVMLAIKMPESIDCIVAAYGIYDIPYLFASSNHTKHDAIKARLENTVGKKSDAINKPSPVYLANQINVPLLLIAGRKDSIAHFEHSNRFKQVLNLHNKDIETLFFKHIGHGQTNWFKQSQETLAIVNFLEGKLNLPTIEGKTELQKELIAYEAATAADVYSASNALIENNLKNAAKLYKKAADLDHPRALFNLGSFYHRGAGVEKDLSRAVEYYEQSAQLDYQDALIRLARMYYEGAGTEKDVDKAYQMLNNVTSIQKNLQESLIKIRLYCQAPQNEFHQNRCLLYSKELLKGNLHNALLLLSRLIIEKDTPIKTKVELSKLVTSKLNINLVSFRLSVDKQGEYIQQLSSHYGKGKIFIPFESIHKELGEKKYCYLKAKAKVKGAAKSNKIIILYNWEIYQNNQLEEVLMGYRAGNLNDTAEISLEMEPTKEYRLNIFNVSGEPIDTFSCGNV